jgi:hypothetical protein
MFMSICHVTPKFLESFYINFLLPFLRTVYLTQYPHECSAAVTLLIQQLKQTDIIRADRCVMQLARVRLARQRNANWEVAMVKLILHVCRWNLAKSFHKISLLNKLFRFATTTTHPQVFLVMI